MPTGENGSDRVHRFDTIFREWLADPQTMVVCGRWEQGSITELFPRGRASLSVQTYGGCFAGLRDLRLPGEDHHIHMDLDRFHQVEYVVTPSVCFQWRPSFQARFLLTSATGVATREWDLSLAVSRPYVGEAVNRGPVVAFFRRFLAQRRRHGGLVEFRAAGAGERDAGAWRAVVECFEDACDQRAAGDHEAQDGAEQEALVRRALGEALGG